MIRAPLSQHIKSYYWCYLLALLLPIALWTWVIPAKVAPTKAETVNVFVGAKTVESDLVQAVMEEKADPGVLKMDVFQCDPEYSLFGTVIGSAGKEQCDFFILSPSSVDINVIHSLMGFLPEESWRAEFPEASEMFVSESRTYGFLLNDIMPSLDSYITLDDEKYSDYYVFLNRESKNFGSFFQAEESESGNALAALHALLDYEWVEQ